MEILISFFIFISFFSFTYGKGVIPKPSDYPVKTVYKGVAAKLDISDPDARMYRTRLTEALKEKPDFAGEYVMAMWGCGTNCRMYSFVNKRTGKLLKDGFGGEERQEDVVFIDPLSRLLVTEEEIRNEDYEVVSRVLRIYVLENQKFRFIRAVRKLVS